MAEKKEYKRKEQDDVRLIRIMGRDIRGDKKVLVGLTLIKGISWAFASALCKILKVDKKNTIQDLSKEQLAEIETFVKDPSLPTFMKNRQNDYDSGDDKHLTGADLKLQNEFDIKRMRKIRSYKGIRHGANLPVRGQRTKSNFRKNRRLNATGIKKK
jgi:small subunit ribosomal protein S13